MTLNHSENEPAPPAPSFWRSKTGLAVAGFLLVALFVLLSEHRAHVFGLLPFLLVLACPLMHLFMHRGHRGHRHGEQARKPDPGAES